MPTLARTYARIAKQKDRRVLNVARKIVKAGARQAALVELGKTVVTTVVDGVETLALPEPPKIVERLTPPRLSWVGGKQFPQHGDSQKGRSGHGPEHKDGVVEHASRLFADEVTKALAPDTPAVNGEPIATAPAPEVADIMQAVIGEYADYDAAKGAALDHSLAMGEPLLG